MPARIAQEEHPWEIIVLHEERGESSTAGLSLSLSSQQMGGHSPHQLSLLIYALQLLKVNGRGGAVGGRLSQCAAGILSSMPFHSIGLSILVGVTLSTSSEFISSNRANKTDRGRNPHN